MFARARKSDGTTIYGTLTTNHAASNYGQAVLVATPAFGGDVYGSADLEGYVLDCAVDADGNFTDQAQRDAFAALAERSGFTARRINGVVA